MSRHNRNTWIQREKSLISDYLNSKIVQKPCETSLDEFYQTALAHIIDSLIGLNQSRDIAMNLSPPDIEVERLVSRLSDNGALSIEDIASFYERMNGLALEVDRRSDVVLVPSSFLKHNKGQFYTPIHVAHEIVRLSLNAFYQLSDSAVTDLHVLDPAVGCGVFLAEAASCLLEKISEANRNEHDFSRALSSLLHGVDVDPIAIRITKALLWSRLKSCNMTTDSVLSNLRVGNSLIGDDGVFASSEVVSPPGPLQTSMAKFWPEGQSRYQQRYQKKKFNWNEEFPHVFSRSNPGFDLIVGNPPYEVLSVKESLSDELRHDIDYFRSNYTSCLGKINTYRLMMERSLNLLRSGGILGLIVPATFLADSSALILRRKILAECEILDLITIPEKARLFSGVTQAFSIIIARKGKPTTSVKPRMLQTDGSLDRETGTDIRVIDLEKIDLRIPVLSSCLEGRLMSHLMAFPTLSTNFAGFPSIGVHQGEINLTTHRRFISDFDTGVKLVRGEHISSFVVRHPSSTSSRLDWMQSDICHHPEFMRSKKIRFTAELSELDSTKGRVAVARVVNMDCGIRLKAAWVKTGVFLGDMTNYLDNVIISSSFTLGLLNSGLLNWRFKALSANNYISAAEIKSLPVPYHILLPVDHDNAPDDILKIILSEVDATKNLHYVLKIIDQTTLGRFSEGAIKKFLIASIEKMVALIVEEMNKSQQPAVVDTSLRLVMDALVVRLYSADQFTDILDA